MTGKSKWGVVVWVQNTILSLKLYAVLEVSEMHNLNTKYSSFQHCTFTLLKPDNGNL